MVGISKGRITYIVFGIYLMLILLSFLFHFDPGEKIGQNFWTFALELIKILPCAFILIGLFEVWVKREHVEKHLGKESGVMGYVWCILLASTCVGGLYVALPVSSVLYHKGAKYKYILTYLGAAAICRIPMTIFESSFLGLKFSIIRLLVSLPLVIISSIYFGKYLEKKNFQMIKV